MIQYLCFIYYSEKDPLILSDSVPHHTIGCELLDTDSARVGASKREVFAHKCDLLAKSLKAIYPFVVIKKVRTQILSI